MSMTALIFAVLLASVLGSLHCVGMCGAFVVLATGGPEQRRGWRGLVSTQAAYHVGRLISYTALGVLAGAAGSLLNLTGALAGVRPVAAALAGVTIATFGIVALLRLSGLRLAAPRFPRWWTQMVGRVNRAALSYPPAARAFAIGLCTTLLPCGWLYAFVITAAGTGHPLTGGIVMASFWLGTVPALAAVGASARRLLDPLNRRIPALTAIFLITLGLYTLVNRAALDPVALAGRSLIGQSNSHGLAPATRPACCVDDD